MHNILNTQLTRNTRFQLLAIKRTITYRPRAAGVCRLQQLRTRHADKGVYNMTEQASFRAYLHSWRTGHTKIDAALLFTALVSCLAVKGFPLGLPVLQLAWTGSVLATLHGDSLPIIVCLLATQVYHAWNQLRTLGMPVRCWPSIMAAVVAELLAENPIRGRLMLGAAMWAMQVLVMEFQSELKTRGKVHQFLTTPDGIDTCSVLP